MTDTAFEELVAPLRGELRAHCYRMLGSLADAEDAVQETLLAAWRGHAGFDGRSSLRTWLYTIATRRCLNTRRDRGRRPAGPLPPFEPPPPNDVHAVPWLEPYPDALLSADPAEAAERRARIELAFVTALQLLPPRQAAAVLLCDVLAFPTAESAAALGVTPTVAKSLLQRGRAALKADRVALLPEGSAEEARLARRFADAFARDDVDALVGLLTDDAWLAMPPAPHAYIGREAIGAFWRASAAWRPPYTLTSVRLNTQPGFALTLGAEDHGSLVLTLTAAGVAGVTRFLPAETPPSALPRREGSG